MNGGVHKMVNNILKNKNGITLVSLVISVIVLLILATISVGMLTGDEGIIEKAQTSKEKDRLAAIQEQIDLWNTKNEINEYKEDGKEKSIEDLINKLVEKGLLQESEKESAITSAKRNGEIIVGEETIVLEKRIASKVNVGDYVNYNPKASTANGQEDIDQTKLSYISPAQVSEGGKLSGGNGKEEQTIEVPDNTYWRVLNIDEKTGRVELIAANEEPKVDNDKMPSIKLQNAIGYLFSEKELNKACQIFGYGYGAYKNLKVSYTVGGPGEEQEETITGSGSGARSITMKDINKITGYTVETSSEGTVRMKYPTVYNNTNGLSSTDGWGFAKTYYNYNILQQKDTIQSNLLCSSNSYWIASRMFFEDSSIGAFYTASQGQNGTINNLLAYQVNNMFGINEEILNCRVKPIVTLRANVDVKDGGTRDEFKVWNLE